MCCLTKGGYGMAEEFLQDILETSGLYYYLTMKDFEREEERKHSKKSRKLTAQEKMELHLRLKDELEQRLSFSNLKKHISPKSVKINNFDDLFSFFSKVNLFHLIPLAEQLDTFIPCCLIDGNVGWISKNQEEHFRYFSKGTNQQTIGFDLLDLLEIYYGCNTSEAIERAVKDFKIQFIEGQWVENQNKKYLSNLTLIHTAHHRIQKQYPILFQYIQPHLKVLETMNVLGSINIRKQEFSYRHENIFFASNAYIANFLGNYTLATTNKVINLFAVLGLIEKVKESDIPGQLLYESKVIADKRNLGNIISYYIVPPMIDRLDEAEKRAILLSKNSVYYTNINRTRIAFVFGEEFAQKIYVQEIQKNKKKKSTMPASIQTILSNYLLELIETSGYATKSKVAKKYIRNTTQKDREQELEKIWKGLLNQHQLRFIKPTKELKAKFGLKSNEYIVIR